MGLEPILPVTIGTMLNFHGDCDIDGHSVRMCKYTLNATHCNQVIILPHKACLHILTPSLSPSPSSFVNVPMVTGRLKDRMGLEPILPVRRPVTIYTINLTVTGTGSETGSECVNTPLQERPSVMSRSFLFG